ncbi:MAG: hypothetical protein ACUVX9_10890 [Anaerolineae bacterium]
MPEIILHRDARVENVEITELSAEPTPLVALSRSRHQLEDPRLDVRGYLMIGSDGQPMGRIEDILLEADERTADRGAPLYHTEYAVVRYSSTAGTSLFVLVPMAVIKDIDQQRRRVVVRGPARLLCQEAQPFRSPDELTPADEQEVYALWEVEPRWQRSGRGPRALRQERR